MAKFTKDGEFSSGKDAFLDAFDDLVLACSGPRLKVEQARMALFRVMGILQKAKVSAGVEPKRRALLHAIGAFSDQLTEDPESLRQGETIVALISEIAEQGGIQL